MANITITPAGAAFNPTDTVTSTRLNEARNPTAALVPASVVPSDLSLGAPSWDGGGTLNVIGSLSSSSIFTSGEAIEINQSGTGDRNAYVDFHTADSSGTDFNARIFRKPGVNADLEIINSGTGAVVISSSIAQVNSNSNSITTKAYVDGTSSFTTEDGQSAGYQVFPSGLKMAWGSATTSIYPTQGGTVTFPTNATGGTLFDEIPTVQLTYNDEAVNQYATKCKFVTRTNFQNYSQSTTDPGRYLAIGI
jgi:hypothetical protein